MWFSLGHWLSTATSMSMTKMEQSPRTGRRANLLELCAAARVESTVNTPLRKETDMMGFTRYEGRVEQVSVQLSNWVQNSTYYS